MKQVLIGEKEQMMEDTKEMREKQSNIQAIEDEETEQLDSPAAEAVKQTARESHREKTERTDSIVEPPPLNGYRNDFKAIK